MIIIMTTIMIMTTTTTTIVITTRGSANCSVPLGYTHDPRRGFRG